MNTTTPLQTANNRKNNAPEHAGHLLGAADIRRIAAEAGIHPTKKFGQNFVIDPGTVRKIVHESGVSAGNTVLEVGPGLGSLTLALLEAGTDVTAIEIDPPLAQRLPNTVMEFMPQAADRLHVINHDALSVTPEDTPELSTAPHITLVANLPYNVAVPAILTALEHLPSLQVVDVMVQLEVAERLAAKPGSRVYGVPSVKTAWYAEAARGPLISRTVFWPVPNVDSALVRFDRRPHPDADREKVFAVIDAAFSQRRKTLRQALAGWAGSPALAEKVLRAADIDPSRRGETLTIDDFVAIAKAADENS